MYKEVIFFYFLFLNSYIYSNNISVESFGAFPGDGIDDTISIQSAISSSDPDDQIHFQSGTYFISKSIVLKDKHSLSLIGKSTIIMFLSSVLGISIKDSSYISLIGMTLCYKDKFSFVGQCLSSSKNEAVFHSLNDGFSNSSFIEGITGWSHLDQRPRKPDLYFKRNQVIVQKDNATNVTITGLPQNHNILADNLYFFRRSLYGNNTLLSDSSTNVTLSNINIIGTPGISIHFKDSQNISLLNLLVKPSKDGDGFSSNADAAHFTRCRGSIFISNCIFMTMGDDAINVHGSYGRLDEVISTNTIQYVTGRRDVDWPAPAATVGDVVSIHHPTNPFGKPLVQGVVLSSQSGSEDKSLQIALDSPISEDLPKDSVVWNQSTSPSLVVTKCKFLNNRARGILIQSSNARIEDNWFQGMTGPAIKVTCDVGRWWESGPTTNIVIRNNFISDCNDGPASSKGAITVDADAPGLRPVAGVHQNIEITGNRIRDVGGMAISISSGSQVRITQNRISTKDSPFIGVTNSTDVLIENNVSDNATSATVFKPTKP